MRNVRVYEEAWPLHTPFVIARGSRSEAKVVVVELEEDGVKGVGECTPYPRYGESIASVMAQVMAIGEQLEAGLTREQLQRLLPAGAARNAIDCALWDLQARREGKTLAQLLGVALPNRVITAQTVVIGTPDQMAASAAALWQAGAQLLKVKLDDRLISERLIAIRQAAPEATLIVDANESWHSEGLAARCQLLADLGVAMLEQPLPADDDSALENFVHPLPICADDDSALENFVHPLPICADESCHTRESLPRLRGRYEMINIKLDKTGGLTEALALAGEAERQEFERMLGCMLCTSRGIAAALPLAPLARFADLDGPTWLAVDVEPALRFSTGVLHL
ncbi:L-Ala-D/L-Glu epimerase [Klebsiella pneumoniae]|uniref:L-Ala-D/L-Glu epimerase n=7 Tax=Klebsiella pneumoniae TaxID=573 RepID=UPI001E4AAA64|nr:L-Ala-D/L-Glu epimerase [Klebsiella pneumoniae]UGQ71100.1 L-Ala-D/L-Glu epimerase [Klebsiella pneumoniae]